MSLYGATPQAGDTMNPKSGAHGEHCSCRALAAATCVKPSSIDYAYCHLVLQRKWRITCDHIPHVSPGKVTREPPPHDSRDPLHALLIANADILSD